MLPRVYSDFAPLELEQIGLNTLKFLALLLTPGMVMFILLRSF